MVAGSIELRAADTAMSEWRQTITLLCTMVLAFVAAGALILSEFGALRAQMQIEHAALRAEMQTEHAGIRDQLNSVDRRTARIEGHLFGIEIAPEQPDGE